jgi:hypothetical protein
MRIETFIDQDLMSLAVAAIPYFMSRSPRREWAARLVGRFSAGLFRRSGDLSIDALSLPRKARKDLHEQAVAVVAKAAQIMVDAKATGLPFHWDYQFRPGRRIDNEWQQPWGPCDAALPAKFLVAPAYVVDGGVYLRQKVYTAKAGETAGQSDTP